MVATPAPRMIEDQSTDFLTDAAALWAFLTVLEDVPAETHVQAEYLAARAVVAEALAGLGIDETAIRNHLASELGLVHGSGLADAPPPGHL
jgi:hypothetical protein